MEKSKQGKSGVDSKITVDGSPTRCPYCHEDCLPESEAFVCQSCLSRHHIGCWTDHGCCASCQGEQVLQASLRRNQNHRCSCCGSHGEDSRQCPICDKESCMPCFQDRFRRCINCSAELLGMEVDLAHTQSSKDHWILLALFSFLVTAFAGFILARHGITDHVFGFVATCVFFALSIASVVMILLRLNQVKKLEISLAPFNRNLIKTNSGASEKS
ncbi:MAG: hypothetical protein P1V97_08640 [Planctomycetota bacterium]|nr:hypothetical protein [Planctomycetota bacterium]